MMFTVNEIFESIQGEGIHTGLPTLFIRFSGCNLRCKWCDTPYALRDEDGMELSLGSIMERVNISNVELVCLTGGEPLIQDNIDRLISAIIESGKKVDIETNGSVVISSVMTMRPEIFLSLDVKTPSSGEEKSFKMENLDVIRDTDQLKFIISDQADLGFSLDFIRRLKPLTNIIFTPCSSGEGDYIAEALLRSVNDQELAHIMKRARLMIQTHKFIWDKERRGV